MIEPSEPIIRIDRINELMSQHGIGPVQLAKAAGLSYEFIYKLRNGGAARISAVSLAKIATALQTSSDYLLNLSDTPTHVELGGTVPPSVADTDEDLQLLQQLVAAARRLSATDQQLVVQLLERLAAATTTQEE